MSGHAHSYANPTYTCVCGRTAEQEHRGEMTHPGVPTTERIWRLVWQLAGRKDYA